MQQRTKLSLIWITLLTYCVGLMSGLAAAAPASAPATTAANGQGQGQALEIAPPVVYISANPGQTITTQIYLRDISSGNLVVTSAVNDFVAAGEDGTPKVLLNNDDNNNPYGMRTWVSPISSLVLVPRQIKSLPVTLNIPANASPGGHYGVIRFTGNPTSLQTSGVSLTASLGALVLVTVSGNVTENLSVQHFTVSHGGKTGSVFQSGPVSFTEILKNAGNVHVQPTGQVSVSDMFGKKIGSVNVNVPPGNILPASQRKFTQSLDKTVIGNKRLFGHYTAKLNISYGTTKKILTASLGFWIIPYKLIFIIILVLVAGFFLIRYFLKRYNQRVIAQAEKRTRQQ